ncbi:MAG: hypothetical protein EOP06_02110 [Proteobacteria bacterium]|nr:MAG: hypothetical protein EOP06_02110 [Pseudomonadota bacterium]
MKRTLTSILTLILTPVIFAIIALAASSANADQIDIRNESLLLTCERPGDCIAMCSSTSCEIAKLTCNACASSADPSMIAIFRSLHQVFQTGERAITKASLFQWIKGREIVAIPVDSPLNIFADPFSADDTAKLQKSFDTVCKSSGRHIVLAEQTTSLKAQAIVCETAPNSWSVLALKYRPDYYKNAPDVLHEVSAQVELSKP